MSVKKMDDTFFHVLHSKSDGKWHVKEGVGGTICAYISKEEAIDEATRLAQNVKNHNSHVIVHKTNGTFEDVKNYIMV